MPKWEMKIDDESELKVCLCSVISEKYSVYSTLIILWCKASWNLVYMYIPGLVFAKTEQIPVQVSVLFLCVDLSSPKFCSQWHFNLTNF